jgi:hypothetical protein
LSDPELPREMAEHGVDMSSVTLNFLGEVVPVPAT